jgi:pimeloyl-ACP methyl ester carboxylesterase
MIDRDGVQLYHEVHGAGPGTPVLLTHGYTATGEMFASTVRALGVSRRCVTWDIRGHGRSDYPDRDDQYSVDLALGDMLAVLDAEGIDRAALLGHSLGGYLSLELQRRHPERVAALVLVDTGPGFRRDDARAGWNAMCATYATNFETRGLAALGSSDEVRAASHRSADGLARAARGILPQHDGKVVDHLPDIGVPTLVVVGSEDRPFLSAAVYMSSKIPGAEQVIVEGAGHAPMITHADTFEREVHTFLTGVDRDAVDRPG